MTTEVDVLNRALQAIGTRTTVAALTEQSNEAIQGSLIIDQVRDELLRMAPWNCASAVMNLAYITSAPGTPENTSIGTATWQPGQPKPPWAYEYQYPYDCVRALWIVPQFETGWASNIPLTPNMTGGIPAAWNGPPQRFNVGVDKFYNVTAAAVAGGGTGYAIGDLITLEQAPAGSAPYGAPLGLQVTGVALGVITSVSIVPVVYGATYGGSYFTVQTNPVAQGSTTGAGSGATFNLTFSAAQADQRVILCNQEQAILCYVRRITDPNVMDESFLAAWIYTLAARLAIALTGDKDMANLKVRDANAIIIEARASDGNEDLTVSDITPDWLRIRGLNSPADYAWSPNIGFSWGPLLAAY